MLRGVHVDPFLYKKKSWQALFVVLTLVYNFALEKRVNIELNNVNSCDFSVSGSVC